MLKYLLAVAVAVLVAQDTRAEVHTIFGFTMGMTQQQVEDQLLPNESEFECHDVDWCTATYLPYGFEDADMYHFFFGKHGEGLYSIIASFECKDDSYGYDVRKVYGEIKADLSGAYGKPREVDYIAHDSLWKDKRYFVMSLKEGHRRLASLWKRLSEGPLADRNLYNVILQAVYREGPEVQITFNFENRMAVEAAKRKARKF